MYDLELPLFDLQPLQKLLNFQLRDPDLENHQKTRALNYSQILSLYRKDSQRMDLDFHSYKTNIKKKPF